MQNLISLYCDDVHSVQKGEFEGDVGDEHRVFIDPC